jgi:3-hydroxybutyryl-CoA dehydratase
VAVIPTRFVRDFTISQRQIELWADVADDHNPLHVDPEYAAGTRFGTTIAHGHLVMAHILEAMLAAVGPAWMTGGALSQMRFRAPVRAGTTCRLSATPAPPSPEAGTLWRVQVADIATGTVCVSGEAMMVTRRAGL